MIPSLTEIDEAEGPFLGPIGEPVLAKSLQLLMQRWNAGYRDRETAIRLLFLCWYGNIEPPYLTGIEDIPNGPELCEQAYAVLGGPNSEDPEVCYTVKLMVELCPWCLGDPDHWERIAPSEGSQTYAARVGVSQFAGRGAYGEYFTHMLSRVVS